jgi:glutamate carboxypeptidase
MAGRHSGLRTDFDPHWLRGGIPRGFAILAIGLATMVGGARGQGVANAQPKLLNAVNACDKDARSLLERTVAIDSGDGDAEGLAAVAAMDAAELKALGATVRTMPPPAGAPAGDNVVATLIGTGKGRILLISHMDTVFRRGDVARVRPHWEGNSYFGPGAGDDKSGAVTAICALQALNAIGFHDFARIDVLLNASEEMGSPGSKDLIRAMSKESDLVLNLERGVPSDQILVARKGGGTLTMEFTGRAAHSGLEPEKGRNAVLEASRVALELGKLADPKLQTTVTVTILQGGERINIVPVHAELKADVRAYTQAEWDRVGRAAAELAAHPEIDGVTITSNLVQLFPPWGRSAAEDAIVAQAQRLYAELGRSLRTTEVGSSADISFAVQDGTPGLDGFAMEGADAHTDQDHADFNTLTPRAYLLARMVMETGHDPKGK